MPYTVLRACGLVPEKAVNGTIRRLQAGQGDAITGTLTRKDLAKAVVGALGNPYAAYKVNGRKEKKGGVGSWGMGKIVNASPRLHVPQ